jgi:hypothetical protein
LPRHLPLQTFDKKKATDKIACPVRLDMAEVLAAAQVGAMR